MTKLYTLFGSGQTLDEILKKLGASDAVSDVKVFGQAEESRGQMAVPAATAHPVAGISHMGGAAILAGGSELEAEGLSAEIAAHFSRNMENGARVVILDTADKDGTKSMLEEAGGIVSEGG